MKLHKLKLSAFGPFAGNESIDFSQLGENPLFLIDGPTGAGKSSLLHAVCYALYGETTDAERKELGIRCDNADPDVLTELKLEFSIRGQRYRIHRVPTQVRPARRGDGETEQKATAHLVRIADDGTEETLVPKKKTEADVHIRAILGLTTDQFRQVMVLPQGKFRELLLAKSDDRQEILSTLFQTEVYKRIEQLLKDKAGDIERQHRRFEESKTEALHEIHIADVDALLEAIAQSSTTLAERESAKAKADTFKRAEEAKLKAAEALQKRFEEQETKQTDLKTHQERKPEVDEARVRIQRAEKAAAIAPLWQTLQGLDQQIRVQDVETKAANSAVNQAKLEADEAVRSLQEMEKRYESRDELKATETRLAGYRKTLEGYESLKAAVQKANLAHQKALSRVEALDHEMASIDKTLEGQIEEIEVLGKQIGQKAECIELQIAAKRRLDTRVKLEAAAAYLATREKAVRVAQAALEEADRSYKQANTNADRLEMTWFTNQAAVLAQKLQLDQPCPVCGSSEHPHPAEFPEDIEKVNQDAVDQARRDASDCLNARYSSETQLTECVSAVQHQRKLITELESELGENATHTVDELTQAHRELEKRLQQICKSEQQLETVKANRKTEETKRIPLDTERTSLNKGMPELSAAKAAAENQLANAEKELPEAYRSLDALNRAILDTVQAIKKLETDYQGAQKRQAEASNAASAAQSNLKALNKQLQDLQTRRTTQSSLWQRVLSDSEFENQADFETSVLEETTTEELRTTVKGYDDKLRSLNSQLELIAQQLADQQPPDMASLEANHKASETAYQEAEKAWTEAQQAKALLNRTLAKIRSLETQQQAVQRQYEVVGKMAKAAGGRGDVRVSLERFVLGNLLDSVLSVASQRLHAMSRGQYRLVRQNEADQKRTMTAGLDLAIDDAYSGKTRPVATLSGGESFMASLALALALSDVVQQRSGGIQLDTLFIDEGFGSLDQESLQLAINTLVELQSSGRTIGIISHVSELKEQMPLRIDVSSSRAGSTVRMSCLP
ncbi:hypothetical protein A8C75_08955 [Marinobacterium aestuarii]|uniref:Rad50/SbcC-type AAA domain-containing protein n=1 Tax=Marinobacterium aestuarii TaxID=1821621 RepID=A0A1A9EY74_9GAMM|nr:SMC family ATPase [Marinobacterium aestuarii]ANG62598.1 hypothetical protein A8C75_08955 [Marinobacterium aestuarii]